MSHERRIFVESISVGEEKQLSAEDSHYLKNVLRLPVAAAVVLVDTNQASEFDAFLTGFSADGIVSVKASAVRERVAYQSNVSVLLCALCKQDASEMIVEKATELGVSTILFFQSDRSIAKAGDEKDRQKKIERFSKIADSAVRQSARMSVPQVVMSASLVNAIEWLDKNLSGSFKCVAALMPHSQTIRAALSAASLTSQSTVTVAVGPEGDFSPKEYELLLQHSFVPVTLGGNRLRAETAAITAIAGIDAVLAS